MRDWASEMEARVRWIRERLRDAGATGVVFGNSGGKDCALTGILCKKACDDTVGLILPGASSRNYHGDTQDALALAERYVIDTRTVDLGGAIGEMKRALDGATELNAAAIANLAPRLRMAALYAVAASENRLVAGTGNRSERHMGYFTKWGDGACDFNPIADLTVTEVYEFLEFLGAPRRITEKAPSAGLFEGQTDEAEMGITYAKIDRFLLNGDAEAPDEAIIARYHNASGHKRRLPDMYGE